MATTSELAYRLGWRVVRILPEFWARGLFAALADWVWLRRRRRVVQLERNLSRVVSHPRDVSRAAVRSYLQYWCDIFRLPDWSPERIIQSVHVTGEHHLTNALARGGVVVALPHMGNWDHAAAWAALKHGRVVTVAERLEPEALFRRFLSFRERLGMEIFPHDDPRVTERLLERLAQGRLVALLADRDMSRGGIPVTLLGESTTFPRGPARLAAQSGATLLPASLWCRDGVLNIDFEGPVDTSDIELATQHLADAFSEAIRRHPQEWHVMQRVFTADRRTASEATRRV
jgi:phosphatidylinositol dimannoside acyltransferase